MSRSQTIVIITGLFAAFIRADAAVAQVRPAVDLAAGYGFLSDAQLHASFPLGWLATVERHVGERVAIAVEIGQQHDRSTYEATTTITGSAPCPFLCFGPSERVLESVRGRGTRTLDAFSLLGGIRYRRHGSSVAPFVHVLAGLVRVSSDVEFDEYFVDVLDPSVGFPHQPEQLVQGSVVTQTRFTIQVGAGLEFPAGRKMRARLGADYRRVFDAIGVGALNQFRVSAEAVVGLGRR